MPFCIDGKSDADHVFYPFAVSITKSEKDCDFDLIFCAVKKAFPEWKPSVLLADGADTITDGFKAVIEAPKICLMCYYYVKAKVDQRLCSITNSGLRDQLNQDINVLQSSQNQQTFEKAAGLFLKKWKKARWNKYKTLSPILIKSG